MNILPGFEDLKPKVVTSVGDNIVECVGTDGEFRKYVLCVEPTGSLKAYPMPSTHLAVARAHHDIDQM